MSKMMLLTKENKKDLQPLYATEEKMDTTQVAVKFFDPYGSWTWWAWEGEQMEDSNDWIFFGLVHGHELELGYWTLSDLKSVRISFDAHRIERDRNHKSETVRELLDRKGLQHIGRPELIGYDKD